MNLSFRLISFREYKELDAENVAKELGLSPENYIALEKGRAKLDAILAQKLSNLYQAPIEFFLLDDTPGNYQAEVLYNNCTIVSGNGGTSGYINHQNNDRGIEEILYLRKEEVKRLERQVEYLREQNDKLLGWLKDKINITK